MPSCAKLVLSPPCWISLLGLLLPACTPDWATKKTDGGLDAASETAADSGEVADDRGDNSGDAADASNEPDAGLRPCSEGCGSHASCNEDTDRCECASGYLETLNGCIVDLCLQVPACGEHEMCKVVDELATCTCESGYTSCDATAGCHDLMSDPLNCGSCGYRCESGLACKHGLCEQPIRQLVLGGNRSCALYDSPSGGYPFKCWGDTGDGLFRDTATEALTPRAVLGLPSVRELAVTADRQCAVPADQDVVRCWGKCGFACGNPDGAATVGATFAEVSTPGVVQISINLTSLSPATCTLSGIGRLACWGAAIIATTEEDRDSPNRIIVGGQQTYTDLSVGVAHGCASTGDGRVACWGSSARNALGVASTSLPNPVSSPGVFIPRTDGGELTHIIDVEVALGSCAITDQGELWCWGDNKNGGLGVGDTTEHVGAVKLGLSDVVQVSLGLGHSCALARSGQVYCWGSSKGVGLGAGALGDVASGQSFSSPQAVPGLADILEVRAGLQHSCARRRNGQVVCWGANDQGQLGDGTKVEHLLPTPVRDLYSSGS
jgi:alpha-tubulin suppressor-like RCC1 family protein